jgi:hypothetical protein
MKTRHLQLAFQFKFGHGGVTDLQEIVEFDEIVQHPGVDEKRGFAIRRGDRVQLHQFLA